MKKELYDKVAQMPTIKLTTKNKDGESTTSYVKKSGVFHLINNSKEADTDAVYKSGYDTGMQHGMNRASWENKFPTDEELYYVLSASGKMLLIKEEGKIKENPNPNRFHSQSYFTEEEIKSFDKGYLSFKVPVHERAKHWSTDMKTSIGLRGATQEFTKHELTYMSYFYIRDRYLVKFKDLSSSNFKENMSANLFDRFRKREKLNQEEIDEISTKKNVVIEDTENKLITLINFDTNRIIR